MKSQNLVCILFLYLVSYSYSQNQLDDKVFETYDALVERDNTGLYNGTEFTDLYLNTDGSFRYFNGFDYSKATINYNGQYFVNVSMRYDLLEDKLLVRSDDNLSIFNIELIPEFVESFSLYGRNFVRLDDTNLNLAGNKFFQVAFRGTNLELYLKLAKRKKEKTKRKAVEYKFTDDNFFLVKKDGKYSMLSSIRDFKKVLPEKEEEIKEFYKVYRSLYKSNREQFMLKLFIYLDGLETALPQP